jgi:hypothetical protein
MEVVEFFRFDDSTHERLAFEMRSWAHFHRDDPQFSGLFEDALRRALAVLFVNLRLGVDDVVDEFAE